MVKSLGLRVCAATMVAGVALGGVAVVGDGNVVGVQRASAEEISTLKVESAQFYTTAGEGDSPDPVGKVTDKETINQVGSLVMKIRVPEGVKAGDTATFRLRTETEGDDVVEANGNTYRYYFQSVDLARGSRIPILVDPDDSTSAIGLAEAIGSDAIKVTFNDAVEKYAGGEIRTLRMPTSDRAFMDGNFDITLRPDSPITPTDRTTPLTKKFYIEYAGNLTKITEHTSDFTVRFNSDITKAQYNEDLIMSGTDYLSSWGHALSAWMDELLYAVNTPGASSRGAVSIVGAPQENPKDLVFSFQLPEGAIPLVDPQDVDVAVGERRFVPYDDPKERQYIGVVHQEYGYTDDLKYSSDNDKPKVSFTYDEATRTYTGTVTNRTPDTALQVHISPAYTLPLTGDIKEEIPVKFISGTSTQKVKKPGKGGKLEEFGSDEPREIVGFAIGNLGEAEFDGRDPVVDFDLDVFVEDTRVDGDDVTGVTSRGESSQAGSLDEAVTVYDGEANYILKVTNKSNVSLSAPRATLPNGKVVYFTRPEDGSLKRWATPTDKGSKIPPGGIGYLVLPAEDIPMGARPTQKDFRVEYQYASEEGNTETARTWIQRFLPDMHVMDVTQYGDEVKVAVGTEDDGVVDVYSFVMTNGVSDVKYDKTTGRLVVTKGPNDVDTLDIAHPRINVGDDGSVVVTGVDAAGKPVETTLHTLKFVTEAFKGIGTDAQERIAKLIGDIDATQGLADAQTERIDNVSDAAESANTAAHEANVAVRDVHTDVLTKIIASNTLTQSQIQQATQEVEAARNAVDTASRETALVREQLSQFDRDIVSLRDRIDGIDAEYQEVVKTYESHERYLKQLTDKVSRNEIALAQLRLDVEAAQNNADENTADITQLRNEIGNLESQIAKDRAAFEAEKAKTAKHRAELDALTTTSEDAVKAIFDELNVIDSRLLVLRDAIGKAQRDADRAKANMVKFGERYADNTIGIGKNNGDIITVPPANKTGIEKCATGIGGAALAFLPVMLLASTAVSQVYIPGISEQMANAQKQLGAFNPELAGFVSRNAGPIAAVLASAGLLGVMAIPGLCGEDSMFDAIGESLSSKRESEAKVPAKVD